MEQKRKMVLDPTASADAHSVAEGSALETVKEEPSCTLHPVSIQFGITRWRRVFENIQDHRLSSSDARFEFGYTEELKAELDALIKQEQICCAHVSWSLDVTPDQLILTLVAESKSLEPIVSAFMPQKNIESDIGEDQ